jgi:hypothetical protein
VLRALAKITTEYEQLCKEIGKREEMYRVFEKYIRHPDPEVRLCAAQL